MDGFSFSGFAEEAINMIPITQLEQSNKNNVLNSFK